MLLAVIFMLAILILSLSIAAPKIAKEIQRDREIETMHRGKQYIRAIKMYYTKFHAYPPNVDALTKPTNGIRFLRKKYVDLTTGKEEWKPIRMGQNKAPTAMGFFGQPMAGSSMGAIGPGGIAGASTLGSGLGSSSGSGSMFGSSSGSSMFGSNSPTGSSSPLGSSSSPGSAGDPAAAAGASDANGTSASAPGLSGTTGQTFGGAGIIGFSPNSPKQSLLVYKKKNHYNEWEFVYDPITDRMMVSGGGAGAGGQSAGSMSTGIGGTGSSFGGSGSGIGPSGNNPITPQSPQQQ
jgi:type II secretory pathway pseudopilin PulG